jgi:RecG-like helicase
MTATPIPRTLAMTLYGDLDVSIIDELPPGRRPVQTFHKTDADRLAVWGFLKREIAKGRQVYVVYPLIKESEKMDYKDLYDGFESISRDFPRPQYQVVAVHGKMKAEDKQTAMREFKDGLSQIMVATSVIEVGVDVPNATVMVIESAERFGLSQLHQLRGRVGRGGEQSYCVLMSGVKLSREARQRLDAMVATNDGFESLSQQFPPPKYFITVVHGRLPAEIKEQNMREFKDGVAHIMVATTVIEVGVDVPNATVMVIESAERFGLSQLHQLRGRVGRGGGQSYCILMSGDKLSHEARKRLEAMVRTNDGFELSELDLQLRGSGDLGGTMQSGQMFDLKIASPSRDSALVEHARNVAMTILDADPQLDDPRLKELKQRYFSKKDSDFSRIS